MTIEEVAEILRVSTRTVRRLCKAGAIECYYIGSQIRITKQNFEKYLNENKGECKL